MKHQNMESKVVIKEKKEGGRNKTGVRGMNYMYGVLCPECCF